MAGAVAADACARVEESNADLEADDGDGDLGDLEGLDAETEKAMRRFLADPSAPSRLYGFKWEDGLVAPWVPCSDEALDAALDVLRPGPDSLVADLGCGDGRILLRSLLRFGCRALGVELDPEPLARAEAAARAELPPALHDRLALRQGDLFDTSLWSWEPAKTPDIFILYLLPPALKRLSELMAPCLASGSVVCTLGWEVPGWESLKAQSGEGWHLYRDGGSQPPVASGNSV
eukprot:TRINITY_DN63759_c0_g1_i1.p1 TRINITY_DN63759_c0_g1~~TRINITY_DN63759_c0_g1_i1.p1  ORF type:complete len:233 (+),score=51.84 TRINITY_DN63759_c0_g1_i1:92-790(+)